MLTLTVHGAQREVETASRLLAAAFRRTGRPVLVAVRDAPPGARARASLRVGAGGLRRGAQHAGVADVLLALDPEALAGIPPDAVGWNGLVVVNSEAEPCGRSALAGRVVAVDATGLARAAGRDADVVPTLLGTLAGLTGHLSLEDLTATVAEGSLVHPRRQVAACVAGYEAAVTLATAAV